MSSNAGTTRVRVSAAYSSATDRARVAAASADCSPSIPSEAVPGWP